MRSTTTLEELIRIKPSVMYSYSYNLSCDKYDKIISYYYNKFGKENVLVLPFEFFVKNKQDTLIKFLNFLGIEPNIEEIVKIVAEKQENEKLKWGTLEFKRIINSIIFDQTKVLSEQKLQLKIASKLAQIADAIIPGSIHEKEERLLKEKIANYVGDIYRESNKKTSELIGFNLAEFGYDC